MKRAVFWIYLLLKRQLKNIAVLLLLVAIPIVSCVVTNVESLNKSDRIRIALYVEDMDKTSVDAVNILLTGEYSFDFYMAESKKMLLSDVYDDEADCGYIFKKDLTHKLDTDDYEGSIQCVYNSKNYSAMAGNEVVFSALFKVYAENIAVNYVNSSNIFEEVRTEAVDIIKDNYSGYSGGKETFHLDIVSIDRENGVGSYVAIEDKTGEFPLKKILVILIYVAGLFGCVQYYIDKEKGSFVTLSKGYRILGMPLYAFINTLAFAISTQISLIIIGEGGGFAGVAEMALYVLAVSMFSWFVGAVSGNLRKMITVIPVLIIACLVLCPVFVNISEMLPVVKLLRKFLLPYYMM
ncbi:MAG: hypothetical protein ACI4E1_09725 [Lachnospira sp.]